VKGHSLTLSVGRGYTKCELRFGCVQGGMLEAANWSARHDLAHGRCSNGCSPTVLRAITTSTCACACTHTCAGTPHRTFQIASDHITSVRRGSPNRRATAQSIDCSDAMKRRTATRAAVFGGYGLWVRFSVKHNIRRKRCQMVTRTTSVHDATHMWRLPMVNLNC
jgi:hypothetical protein